MASGKQNPALQGAYVSENLSDGSYYTLLISFAGYDSGEIQGSWGKNTAPGSTLGKSGYHRLDSSEESSIGLNFGGDRCILLAIDHKYQKLSGNIYNKEAGTEAHIVFNKS